MVGAIARGAQSMHSNLFKAVLWKGYHRGMYPIELKSVVVRSDGKGENNDCQVGGNSTGTMWIPHQRTGIYYPMGQEGVMEDIQNGASTSMEIHYFSYSEGVMDHFTRK